MSRTSQSIKNIATGIGSQILLAVLSFITTKLIKVNLGFEYIGLNGVFNNIMSFMGLTELGIGTAIVFALYKPLSENNTKLITIIMHFYKKAYLIISIVVFGIGLILLPLLPYFVHTTLSTFYVQSVFLLFVFNTSISYILSYKRNLIFADQKNYIITIYSLIFSIVTKFLQLLIFIITKSYILYLIISILCTTLLNIVISCKADKLYPYLRDKTTEKLPFEVKQQLTSKIKALFFHSIGTFCVAGTDNILISYFLGVSTVGKYNSHIVIVTLVTSLVNQIYDGISSSLGNFLVEKNIDEQYELFKKMELLNSIIVIFVTVCLTTLITPFVGWWLGSDSTLSPICIYFIGFNVFLGITRKPVGALKNAAGLFEPDKFAPIIESAINLVASCILAHFFGLAGIIIGTTISTLCIPIWIPPKIVFKTILKKKLFPYFMNIINNLICCVLLTFLCTILIHYVFIINSTLTLIIDFIVTIIITAFVEYLLFRKNKYYNFFTTALISRIRGR